MNRGHALDVYSIHSTAIAQFSFILWCLSALICLLFCDNLLAYRTEHLRESFSSLIYRLYINNLSFTIFILMCQFSNFLFAKGARIFSLLHPFFDALKTESMWAIIQFTDFSLFHVVHTDRAGSFLLYFTLLCKTKLINPHWLPFDLVAYGLWFFFWLR